MPDSPYAMDKSNAPRVNPDASDQVEEIAALKYDVAARTAIDLATGILMEQRGINADEALALLQHLTDRAAVGSVADGIVRLQSDENLDAAGTSLEQAEAGEASKLDATSREPRTS